MKKHKYLLTKLLGIVSLICLLDCQSLSNRLVSDKKMNLQGSAVFAQMKKKTPIERNQKVNTYVKCIARAILSVTRDNTGVKSWEVVVLKDKSPNAFALPGRKIGVHTGILPIANSQGQLEASMGHEVGHVIARHSKQRYAQSMVGNLGQQAAKATGGAVAGAAVGVGLKYGVLMPFSRSHETEADLIGLHLMARAGFDPHKSVELWINMRKAAGGKAPPEFLSTHPSGKTRIKNLRKMIPKVMPLFIKAQEQGRRPKCG